MGKPPPGATRALLRALEEVAYLCPRCDGDEFSLTWSPWRDRWSLVIWHESGCPVLACRTRARQAARLHLAGLLAPSRELAPVYTRHLADA